MLSFHGRVNKKKKSEVDDLPIEYHDDEQEEFMKQLHYRLICANELNGYRPKCILLSTTINPCPKVFTCLSISDCVKHCDSFICSYGAIMDAGPMNNETSTIAIRRIISRRDAPFVFVLTESGEVYFKQKSKTGYCIHGGIRYHNVSSDMLIPVNFESIDESQPKIVNVFIGVDASFFLDENGNVWACGCVKSIGYSRHEIDSNDKLQCSIIREPVCITSNDYLLQSLRNKKVLDIAFYLFNSEYSSTLFITTDFELILACYEYRHIVIPNEPNVDDQPEFIKIYSIEEEKYVLVLTKRGYILNFGVSGNGYHLPSFMPLDYFDGEEIKTFSASPSHALFLTVNNRLFAYGKLGYSWNYSNGQPQEISFSRNIIVQNVFTAAGCSVIQTNWHGATTLFIHHKDLSQQCRLSILKPRQTVVQIQSLTGDGCIALLLQEENNTSFHSDLFQQQIMNIGCDIFIITTG
jgi:hypothetical protein